MLLIISNTDRELFYSLPSSKEEQGTSNTQIQDRNLG